jgi:hypothetical protein
MDLTDIFGNLDPSPPAPAPTENAKEFLNDFFEWLETGYEDKDRAPGLHASGLSQVCARRLALEAQTPPAAKVEAAAGRLTYDIGHAMHYWAQNHHFGPWGRLIGDWFCVACQKVVAANAPMPKRCPECDLHRRDSIVFKEPFVVDHTLKYCGHSDGIVLDKTGTRRRVFEFKSISPSQYDKLREPKMAHVIQAHAYMKPLGLDEALIVYLNKGSQGEWAKGPKGWTVGRPKMRAFLVSFDTKLWASMVERIAAYHKADESLQKMLVVDDEFVMSLSRICTHDGCDLAQDCPVSAACFKLPR